MQRSVKSRPEIIKRYYIHATGHLPLIHRLLERKDKDLDSGGRGGGVLGLIFAGYVPLAFQSPYPIMVYSVANYRPHLSHFWANM